MSDDLIIIKDLLPVQQQKHLLDTMTGFNFPWVLNKNIVSGDDWFINQKNNPPGFNHFFYEKNAPTSSFFEMVYPIVLTLMSRKDIPFNNLIRMRGNLTLANGADEADKFMPHIDSFYHHWVAIYYVNDSDGDTIIFNEINETYDSGMKDIDQIRYGTFTIKHRIKPEQGKLIAFPGKYYHTASFCKENDFRCLININLGSLFQ